jgi:hypothetical protein
MFRNSRLSDRVTNPVRTNIVSQKRLNLEPTKVRHLLGVAAMRRDLGGQLKIGGSQLTSIKSRPMPSGQEVSASSPSNLTRVSTLREVFKEKLEFFKPLTWAVSSGGSVRHEGNKPFTRILRLWSFQLRQLL